MTLAVTLRTGSAVERVAATLWQLGNGMNAADRRIARVSQGELGMLAALSRQHTNLALHKLREMNLVAIHRSGIVVPDLEALPRSA